MSEVPSIAVALEGGLVIAVVLQGWPATLPEPRVVVVDYDTQDADDVDITRFPIGDGTAEAVCYSEAPVIYERLADALSPNVVLAALAKSDDLTD